MQLPNSLQQQLARKSGQLDDDGEVGVDKRPETSPDEQSTLARIAVLIEKISSFDTQEIAREHTSTDLGLDSLDRIELAVRIEQVLGVRLDDRKVAQLTTVGELSDYVDEVLDPSLR